MATMWLGRFGNGIKFDVRNSICYIRKTWKERGVEMAESLWHKLQRVKIKDIGHIFLFLLAFPISAVYRRTRKDLWVICDNENEARDNGYWLFRYIREQHKEQDVIYAINKKSPDYIRVKDLGIVVQYGSFMHWIYYLSASKNISSQKEGKPNAAVCYLLEVYGILKNTRIFLQHGITKDDAEFLHYKNTKMRLFVCAVEEEYQYVREQFGYPEGWVQNLGFCRFDNLYDTSVGKRQLLVMPTWRNWISTPTSRSYELEDIDNFKNTAYYKHWVGLLQSKRLHRLLEEENITLVFYPHRGMQKYLKYFELDHSNIVLAKWPEYDVQELLKESNLLITDYSSIAMDFAYMKKPLFYYQFDYEMFRRGQYKEGYFSYQEDGFGPVSDNLEALLGQVEQCVKNNFKMDAEYKARTKHFYTQVDQSNCRRNYEAIRAI